MNIAGLLVIISVSTYEKWMLSLPNRESSFSRNSFSHAYIVTRQGKIRRIGIVLKGFFMPVSISFSQARVHYKIKTFELLSLIHNAMWWCMMKCCISKCRMQFNCMKMGRDPDSVFQDWALENMELNYLI